jgi:hypothetical protein
MPADDRPVLFFAFANDAPTARATVLSHDSFVRAGAPPAGSPSGQVACD